MAKRYDNEFIILRKCTERITGRFFGHLCMIVVIAYFSHYRLLITQKRSHLIYPVKPRFGKLALPPIGTT